VSIIPSLKVLSGPEVEGGVAANESTSIALQKAIEEGVLEIIKVGINKGYWEYEKTN
jgi:hypothetical protein